MLGRGNRVRAIVTLWIGMLAGCHADVGPKQESTTVGLPQIAVSLRDATIIIGVGESVRLELEREVPGGVEWRSAAPEVVRVSENGLVTALAPGRAQVFVRSATSADTADVTVHGTLGRIEFQEDTLELALDKRAQLGYRAFDAAGRPADPLALHDRTWTSSRAAVARVDSAGSLFATELGTTDIVVRAGTVADTVTIRVVQTAVERVAIEPPLGAAIAVGLVDTLRAMAWDASGRRLARRIVTWSNSDPTVASVTPVSAGALLAAVRPGTTTVTVSSEGRKAAMAIEVGPRPVVAYAEPPRVFLRTSVEDTPSHGRILYVQPDPMSAAAARSAPGAGRPFTEPPDQ